jgi:hypothetical protein
LKSSPSNQGQFPAHSLWSEQRPGIALDAQGNAVIVGETNAGDLLTRNPLQSYAGVVDAFVTKLVPGWLNYLPLTER